MTELSNIYITPTETATYYSLVNIIVIGGLASLILAELIKNKKSTPVSSLSTWAVIFGIITTVSVFDIKRSSK